MNSHFFMQHYINLLNVKNQVKAIDLKMEGKLKAHELKTV